MFGPANIRADSTYVFASPVQDGHVPMTALSDIGLFARYAFDNRAVVSGADLKIVSERVGWDKLVQTFTRVTGKKAVYVRQTPEEWVRSYNNAQRKVAKTGKEGGSLTWEDNFKCVRLLRRIYNFLLERLIALLVGLGGACGGTTSYSVTRPGLGRSILTDTHSRAG